MTSRVFKVQKVNADYEFAILETKTVGVRRYYVVLYCNRASRLSAMGLNKCPVTCPRVCALRRYVLFGNRCEEYEILELDVDAKAVLNEYGSSPIPVDTGQVVREAIDRVLFEKKEGGDGRDRFIRI